MPDPGCFKTAPPLEDSIERCPRGGYINVILILELWGKIQRLWKNIQHSMKQKLQDNNFPLNDSFRRHFRDEWIKSWSATGWNLHRTMSSHRSSHLQRKWLSHRQKTEDQMWIKTSTEDDTFLKKSCIHEELLPKLWLAGESLEINGSCLLFSVWGASLDASELLELQMS